METFNIKEAGKELEKTLKREFGSENGITITIDVQIPQVLYGDKRGFYNSIIQICSYLNRYIIDLTIDIQLSKIGQYASEVKLNVDIRGSHLDRLTVLTFVKFQQDQIRDLLKLLPLPTQFSHSEVLLHFSFFMTFEYSGQPERETDIFRDKKILLAENNELSALTFTVLMEEWGCRVTKVTSVLSAIEEVKRTRYHIILIDIHSPEMHGLESIRKIRNFDQHIPIIGLTSPWTKDHALDARTAGANDIVTKPVSSGELQKILRKYI